ncbi:MAG: hypothetical protein L6V90_12630 [Treponema succinifaciens]|nr:MAG: hypothetical protein L6V90_12630 [Treponema succinifaciens]
MKFIFDSPVVLVFFCCFGGDFFISDLIFKSSIFLRKNFFECPGAKSVPAFDFKSALSYVKLVIYPFGGENSTSFFLNIGFILLLGPVLEERYGSIMLALMIFITSLVGGVLTACVSTFGIYGCGGIVFMMIILSVLSVFIKKQLPVSWIFIFALYLAFSLFSGKKISGFMPFMQNNVPVFIQLASGICGSLFGFFVCPKKRSSQIQKKQQEKTIENEPENSSGSDETIVGNISL